MDLKAILGLRPKEESSKALRETLADAEGRAEQLRLLVTDLGKRRAALLLAGDVANLEKIENDLAGARTNLERMEIIVAAYPESIAAAEQREADKRLDELAAEASALSDEGLALLQKIEAAARVLGDLVEKHDAIAERVHQANIELNAAGRDRVMLPTARAWSNDPNNLAAKKLGMHLGLPGPWSPCNTLKHFDQQLARAKKSAAAA